MAFENLFVMGQSALPLRLEKKTQVKTGVDIRPETEGVPVMDSGATLTDSGKTRTKTSSSVRMLFPRQPSHNAAWTFPTKPPIPRLTQVAQSPISQGSLVYMFGSDPLHILGFAQQSLGHRRSRGSEAGLKQHGQRYLICSFARSSNSPQPHSFFSVCFSFSLSVHLPRFSGRHVCS